MAHRLHGVEQVTTQNLPVVDVDVEKGLLLIKGAIPGHAEAIVYVKPSVKVAPREQHKGARAGMQSTAVVTVPTPRLELSRVPAGRSLCERLPLRGMRFAGDFL